MNESVDLETVRYYDRRLRMLRRLFDYVAEAPMFWDQLHPAEQYGWLRYFDQRCDYRDAIVCAIQNGKMTGRQMREWRNLERLFKDVDGTVKVLRERYAKESERLEEEQFRV